MRNLISDLAAQWYILPALIAAAALLLPAPALIAIGLAPIALACLSGIVMFAATRYIAARRISLARYEWFWRLSCRLIARTTQREPDFIIHNDDGEYLRRWYVIPRNPILNLYLHCIVGSDDDRALHCHPWLNISVLIAGNYREIVPTHPDQPSADDYLDGGTRTHTRTAGDVIARSGNDRHRLVNTGAPCWTLFITGPVFRRWGFWCRKGFVYWRKFVSARDKGAVGAGCGD